MMDKKKNYLWVIIVAVIAVVAVVGAVLFMRSSDGSAPGDQATSQTSTTSTSSAAPGNSESSKTLSTDIWGRKIVSRSETGEPIGKLNPQGDSCAITPEVEIQTAHGAATLWSRTDGPSEIKEGVPSGYAHTATGAALAGWNNRLLLFAGGDVSRAISNVVTAGDEQKTEELRSSFAAGSDDSSQALTKLTAPEAVRVLSCDDEFVVVDFAHKIFGDENGKSDVMQWDIMRASMQWNGSEWVLDLRSFQQSGEVITSINSVDGWTKWQY